MEFKQATVVDEDTPKPSHIAEVESEIKRLEAAAMSAHLEAQALNKLQRCEEANAKYDEMRRLDARALELANSLGCPSCRKPSSGAAGATPVAAGDAAADYISLHPVTPWPAQAAPGAAARALGAVLGAAVGDAAAMGVQWIYSLERLEDLLAARREAEGPSAGLEFYEPPQSPFLPGYATGRHSPYGEEAAVLLRSLAREGGLDCGAYAELYAETFGEGFDGYRNASTTGFLRNYSRGMAPPATGAEDAQADCVARLAPLVAAFAGHPRLMRLVAAATRTTQNTDDAEAWACAGAAVLEGLVLRGAGMADAVAAAADELASGSGRLPACERHAAIAALLRRVLALRDAPHAAVVSDLGRNCHMPNAALTPLHAALHQEWLAQRRGGAAGGEAAFVDGIRGALAAGGCCASRAGFAGACLGAMLGPGAVPAGWRARCGTAAEVKELFGAISAARGA